MAHFDCNFAQYFGHGSFYYSKIALHFDTGCISCFGDMFFSHD